MTCKEFKDYIFEYIDGLVSVDETTLFEAHLKTCPDCIKLLEEYQTIKASLSGLNMTESVPEDFSSTVMNNIKEIDRLNDKPKRFPVKRAAAFMSFAALFLVVIAIAFLNRDMLLGNTKFMSSTQAPTAADYRDLTGISSSNAADSSTKQTAESVDKAPENSKSDESDAAAPTDNNTSGEAIQDVVPGVDKNLGDPKVTTESINENTLKNLLGSLESGLSVQNISFQFIALLDLKGVDGNIITGSLDGYEKKITVENIDAYSVTKADIKKITDKFALNQVTISPNYLLNDKNTDDTATGILAVMK